MQPLILSQSHLRAFIQHLRLRWSSTGQGEFLKLVLSTLSCTKNKNTSYLWVAQKYAVLEALKYAIPEITLATGATKKHTQAKHMTHHHRKKQQKNVLIIIDRVG